MRARVSSLLLLLTVFAFANSALAAESDLAQRFGRALDSSDFSTMTRLVKENRKSIPAEVNALMDAALAPGVAEEAKNRMFTVAEFMADEYKNQTEDITLLKNVKVRIFESKLGKPAAPVPENGVYVVDALSTPETKNIFAPDNIVIKKGSIVKWVNKDSVAHLLASVPVIGQNGIFSPTIEPGQTWQYRFTRAGEYYYICFIHKIMYGKVTVVE